MAWIQCVKSRGRRRRRQAGVFLQSDRGESELVQRRSVRLGPLHAFVKMCARVWKETQNQHLADRHSAVPTRRSRTEVSPRAAEVSRLCSPRTVRLSYEMQTRMSTPTTIATRSLIGRSNRRRRMKGGTYTMRKSRLSSLPARSSS